MPEKVLVIDDEKSICDAISLILRSDYSVTTAISGTEGLLLAESMGFDCIISDIKMDGVSGIDVLKRIKEMDGDVPVIMITAFGSIDSA